MKGIIKLLGLFTLICFSFFYTDKVIEVVREEDKIMIEIQNVKDNYRIEPMDAKIVSNTIVPGLNGRKVNVEKSYKKMKETGIFNQNLMVYDELYPDISVKLHKDKYIILGNSNRKMVSLMFVLDSDKYFNRILSILKEKGVVANYFVDYSYLLENSIQIKEMVGHEFYSYGIQGKYTPDNLLFSNNLISRISENEAIYCLASSMEKEILELCSENDLYTIVPSIIGGTNPYSSVKENLFSGSSILLMMNLETINELSTVIDYIRGKGFEIGTLSELFSEELKVS